MRVSVWSQTVLHKWVLTLKNFLCHIVHQSSTLNWIYVAVEQKFVQGLEREREGETGCETICQCPAVKSVMSLCTHLLHQHTCGQFFWVHASSNTITAAWMLITPYINTIQGLSLSGFCDILFNLIFFSPYFLLLQCLEPEFVIFLVWNSDGFPWGKLVSCYAVKVSHIVGGICLSSPFLLFLLIY